MVSLEVEAGLNEDSHRWGLGQEVPWEHWSLWRSKLDYLEVPDGSNNFSVCSLQVISKELEGEGSLVYGCSDGVGIEDGYGLKTKTKKKEN